MNYHNLSAMQRLQAQRLGPLVALRYKKNGLYHDITWQQYREMTEACALALLEVGVQKGDRVGLLAENRWEWLVADMGILAAGAVNVPPHAPLTARQVHFQLDHPEVRWLFVSTAEQLDKVRQIRNELPHLQGVVVFNPVHDKHTLSWEGFLQRGRLARSRLVGELERREADVGLEDLATIIYTSGTTGNPKGVMLTHGNLLSNAIAADQASPREQGVLLNWLPFSHIYARTVDHYLGQVAGVPLCLADSVDTLVQNLEEIQPTHMSSVPRFYEKVLNSVADPDPKKSGKKLRNIFGARVDWLGSGGAPLPLAVAQAYEAAGLLLLQGYGLTESSPVISFNRRESYKLASVGQALPGVEVKIGPDGEVLTRGPHVMKGYWKNPQATAETIRDGWLHTGDLGQLDDEGFLTITGRKKELLVLSNGKKVVPNQIESLLIGDPCIDQVVIHGEGRNFLTALIVPSWGNLRQALADKGETLPDTNPESLVQHPAVLAHLTSCIDRALVDVAPWEQIKKFVIVPQPFTVAADELTVSLKLRRNVILGHHQEELDALYR
jgi:long-chain acyl-CoA synthetase